MAMDNLVLTPPPHLRSKEQTAVAMRDVLIALAPITIAALVAFTYNALFNIAVCVGSAMFFELVARKIRKRKVTLSDGSAAVTGLLLALLLPAKIHWLNMIIASFVAVVIVKELMGGLGRNIFNPALFGFVFILIGSGFLASWTGHLGFLPGGFDGVQAATPVAYIKHGLQGAPSYAALLFANYGGAISEVGCFWILLGGAYLLYRKVINWVIPVTILATVFILAYILGSDGLYQILAGGVMLGAFFMATDWVTSPMYRWGQAVFGLIIGICIVLIRLYGGPSGAVAYSILIGNAFVPLLDKVFKPKRFGEVVAA
ncbi:RnfABCDGE type electron transport complex subunit D [Candidatus Solincola tengchongensis]|uniref:RnfABCDGE type electron transport complex subunit D n=1 Tax=Candidatus Solincola tengchongensis TaxID=2900693 RepID=UPI0025800743|nr:RnfABCDGE type electron transport complex subunit D [Candidatus Solincola tengchongensis]